MNKISKLLSLSAILSISLIAGDDAVINFEKSRISQNPNVKVNDIKISAKKELALAGWYGYILDVQANVQGKDINAKDIIFSDGKFVAPDLIDMKTGKSMKDSVNPNLSEKYYDKSKLIAGNPNAKDKLVLFSDPLCPFCIDFAPDVINYVNKNSSKIALYYYNFPLQSHPASTPLVKIIEVAKQKGLKDVELKVYQTKWEQYFDAKSTDEKKILEAFNKEFKTDIKLDEINAKSVNDNLQKDISMGEEALVQGTPTIFINGEKDSSRQKYETLGK